MKRTAILVVIASLNLAAVGVAVASEELAKKSGCLGCHNVEGAKKMGASFKDLGTKYKGDKDAEKKLTAKLNEAKGHPKAKSTPEDNATLVKWILGMAK